LVLPQGFFERLVPTQGTVGLQLPQVGSADVPRQDLFHIDPHPCYTKTLSQMERETSSLCKFLEYLIELCFRQMRVHDLVVDVHHRRLITRGQTLHTAQGKTPVRGGFAGFDAQLVFEIAQATARSMEGA